MNIVRILARGYRFAAKLKPVLEGGEMLDFPDVRPQVCIELRKHAQVCNITRFSIRLSFAIM
jgi:hypothetical protein